MVRFLVLLIAVVPLLEVMVLVAVGRLIGAWTTVALTILISFAGLWLARQQGLEVLRRAQSQLAVGQMPAGEVLDGLLVLFGGLCLATPGFITDAVGLLCLIPATRGWVKAWLRWQIESRFL